MARWLAVALALAAILGVGTVLYAPDRAPATLLQRWAPAPSQLIVVGRLQLHLRDVGPRDDPLPLVLLHGTSSSLHTWEGWVAPLARTRRVITLDLPGFGLTGPAPDGDYRIASDVRFVLQVADTLQVRRFVLGGNSLGGEIAWNTALAAPDRVAALILVDAAGFPLDPQDVPLGFRVAATPGLRTLAQVTLPRALVERSVRQVYGDPARVTPELVDRYYELTLRAGNRAALSQRIDALLREPSPFERLPAVTVPTLILWGGRDRLIPLAHAQRFAQSIPGATLVVFDGLGHVPQEEDPARTVQAVEAFLARVAPR